MRFKYKEIFPDLPQIDDAGQDTSEVKQLQTIVYAINLLPTLKDLEDGTNFMIACDERGAQELNLFTQRTLNDWVDYKWENYAKSLHIVGASAHSMYIATLAVYIYTTYLIGQFGERTSMTYPILMCFGLFYPFVYDTM